MDENNLTPEETVVETTTPSQSAPAEAAASTPVATTPFDKGVITTEDILASKPVQVTTGKNAGTIQYVITTVSGKEIWNDVPPADGETKVSFGLTEKGYTNFIGYASFRSLTVEQRFAVANRLAQQAATASNKLIEESKAPEAMATLLKVNIKDLL